MENKAESDIDLKHLLSKVDNLQIRVNKLEENLNSINQRNMRVEQDKNWETSITRFICVAAITYFTMNLILWTIEGPFPPVNAIVPTAGYMLSTLSLRKIKEQWKRRDS